MFSLDKRPVETATQRTTLLQILIAVRELATNLYPGITLSSPSFFNEGSTPVYGDTEHKIVLKILGALVDINTALTGGPAGCGTYIRRRSGVGSPNGVVTACVGETYWDTAGNLLYVKDSGDGTNTGWV